MARRLPALFPLAPLALSALLLDAGAAADEPSAAPADPAARAQALPAAGGEADEAAVHAKREEARALFEKAVALIDARRFEAAVPAFLRSIELYPTRAATNNAAYCLRQLGRFDEALDMYERLLRRFPELSPSERQRAQEMIDELRGLVGTIDITGGEAGASISVDGRSRGDYPPLDALRVSAGSHLVRLYKEGFEPFEASVEVIGGKTARIHAALKPLARSGRLKVVEPSGRALDVVLDGVVVGQTPWEASVAVGEHTVWLRGEGDLGSQPVSVRVASQALERLVVAAEPLGASLLVRPVPAGASVAVDAVTVGRGVWEGRLRVGDHRVEVAAEGFLAESRPITLAPGERRSLNVELRRDPASSLWRRPSKLVLEASAALPLSPSLGGDVAGGCGEGCSLSLGAGALAQFHGGYELPSGFGVGLSMGYLFVAQSATDRAVTLRPVGLPERSGSAEDALQLSGFLAGAEGWLRFGERWPILVRLGAGALLGGMRDERRTAITDDSGRRDDLAPAAVSAAARYIYVAPEARVGLRLEGGLELGAGVSALLLIAPSQPTWSAEKLVDAGEDGAATYPAESLSGRLVLLLAPGVTGRYTF